MNFRKTFIIFSVSIFVFFSFGSIKAHASASDNLYGQAWSMDSGWISFNNCSNPSTCTGIGYGVNMDPVTGNLSGEAWSFNLGWISFDQTSGCPISGCVTQPKVNKVTGNFTGFARALSNGGGWDGWIPLNATDVGQSGWGFKENVTTGAISGQAWGDLSMGWITPDGSLKIITDPNKPFVKISADPTSGDVNTINPALTWSATKSPTSCTATETTNTIPAGAIITWSGIKASSGSSIFQGILTKSGTYTYTLECKNSAGTGSDSVTITAKDSNAPSGTLTINPCTISVNASTCTTNISWTTKNLTANPTQITNNSSLTPSFNPSPLASGSKTITLGGSSTTFYLYHQSVSLADISKSGDCAINSVWNGSICASVPATFTITADSIPSSEGSITPPGKQTVNSGDDQTYVIQSNTSDPYSSYQISTIVVDGSTAVTLPANTTAYSYPFTNITDDHTISATFTLLPPPPPVDGECKIPALHYQCAVGVSVNNKSNAKSWNWTCAGSPAIPPSATTLGRPAGGDASCIQNKPLYQEN